MAFAQGSRSSLSSIAETAFGTTPAAPTFALALQPRRPDEQP